MAKKVQTVEMDGITFEVIGIFDYEGQDYLALRIKEIAKEKFQCQD